MKEGYPELVGRADYIYKVIELEEERFQRTLEQGMAILTELMAELEAKGAREISGPTPSGFMIPMVFPWS